MNIESQFVLFIFAVAAISDAAPIPATGVFSPAFGLAALAFFALGFLGWRRRLGVRAPVVATKGLLATVVLTATPANAELLVVEDFESYSAATDINGGAGGSGWTANWTGVTGDATVQLGAIPGYGKSLRITDSGSTDPIARREFTATSGPVYLGLLLRSTALANDEFFQTYMTSATGNNTTGASTGLRNNANNPLFARIRDSSGSGATHNSTIFGDDGITRQLVLKVTKTGAFGANYDQSDLFVGQFTEGTPDATTTLAGGPKDSLVSAFARFGLRTFQFDLNSDIVYLDEIRIATTYEEALAPPIVPEPSTLALSALGLLSLGIVGWRRRRARRLVWLSVVACVGLVAFAAGPAAAVTVTTNDGQGADAYVQGTMSANGNFGTSTELRVKFESNTGGFNRKTYLRFDLSGTPKGSIDDAELALSLLDPVSTAGTNADNLTWNFNVYGLNDSAAGQSWIESGAGGITWNNAPANITVTGSGYGNGLTGDATLLGMLTPSIIGRGSDGATHTLSGAGLDAFLNSDTDNLLTFIVTRVEPQDATNTVVHIFSSGENTGAANPTLTFNVVPEPSAFGLAALAFVALGFFGWRRRRGDRAGRVPAKLVIPLVALVLVVAQCPANAAPFLYDGFPAGGATPAAGEYQSDPNSTDGVDNDSIRGQGPSGIGFDAGDNWGGASGTDAVASVVFPRVLDSGLNYFDNSSNSLVATAGAVDWHRDNSTSVLNKRETRDTNLSPSLPETGYFSALMQFTSGTFGQAELLQADGGGGNARYLFFGFNSSGNAVAGTNTGSTVTGSTVFAADNTYLLFGEVVNDGVVDDLRLWVNPSDLSDPTSDTPELVSTNIGPGWVGGNPNFTIREMRLFANTSQFSQFVWDEIRVGSTIEDVLPFSAPAIPEPTTMSLALIGFGLLGMRRRRRHR